MRPLIASELLRLRTVPHHVWVMVGVLAVVASNAAPFFGAGTSDAEGLSVQIRGLAQLGFLAVVAYVAYVVAEDFRRGAVAATFLVHPNRSLVLRARAVLYAGLGAALALAATALALGIVLPVAVNDGIDTGIGAPDVLLALAGSAVAGAVMGAAGVLVAVAVRHPGATVAGIVGWNLTETLATGGGTRDGLGDYLPFQLAGSATGLGDVNALLAMALLLLQLAIFAWAVRRWALGRDMT